MTDDYEEHPPIYSHDNPGGDWLMHKQKYAEEQPERYHALVGAVTGSYRNLKIPPADLIRVPGAMDEETFRSPGNIKYDYLAKKVKEEGWYQPQRNQILIGVNHHGKAFILEGNHRMAYAHNNNIPHIWTEVRYFNGGERVPGPFHPDNIKKSYVE